MNEAMMNEIQNVSTSQPMLHQSRCSGRPDPQSSSVASSRSSSLSSQYASSECLGNRVVIARPGLVVVRGGKLKL